MTLADADVANRIIHHPEVYPDMCDDYADPAHTQLGRYLLQQETLYLLHPNAYTIFCFAPRTLTLFEVHTMIEPAGRGAEAVFAAREALKWLFENTTCAKVITYVPFFNRKARIFARKVGLVDEGVCTKSFKKDGTLHDQWVLGIEKEALCQS
jgi:hypothetical protein